MDGCPNFKKKIIKKPILIRSGWVFLVLKDKPEEAWCLMLFWRPSPKHLIDFPSCKAKNQ